MLVAQGNGLWLPSASRRVAGHRFSSPSLSCWRVISSTAGGSGQRVITGAA